MMQVYRYGDGDPVLAVIAGVHGDEHAGPAAIRQLLDADPVFHEPVLFIIANEAALAADQRFLDTDLNRCFPGDPDSDLHEERLAAEITAVLNGCRVLDLHETHSTTDPFAISDQPPTEHAALLRSCTVEHVADFTAIEGDSLTRVLGGIVVETGPQGTDHSAEDAYRVLHNVLAAEGIIDGPFETTDPDVFKADEMVDKEPGTRFTAENFTMVETGETYATGPDGTAMIADEPFAPVLMSTDGYVDVLGFRAHHVGRLSEL